MLIKSTGALAAALGFTEDALEKARGLRTERREVHRNGRSFWQRFRVGQKEEDEPGTHSRSSERRPERGSSKRALRGKAAIAADPLMQVDPQWKAKHGAKLERAGIKIKTFPPKGATEVSVNFDPDNPWVYKWRDHRSGTLKYIRTSAYTKGRSEVLLAQVASLTSKDVNAAKQAMREIQSAKTGNTVKMPFGAAIQVTERVKESACILDVMMHSGVRVGSTRHNTREKDPTTGASTLRVKHVEVDGDTVTLRFVAKKQKNYVSTIKDAHIASMLKSRMRGKSANDYVFPLASEAHANELIKQLFSPAKNPTTHMLRRRFATIKTAEFLDGQLASTKAAIEKAKDAFAVELILTERFLRATEYAGDLIQEDQPETARSCYVSPHIFADFAFKAGGTESQKVALAYQKYKLSDAKAIRAGLEDLGLLKSDVLEDLDELGAIFKDVDSDAFYDMADDDMTYDYSDPVWDWLFEGNL